MNDALRMKDITGLSTNVALFTTMKTAFSIWADIDDTELQTIAEEYYMHSSEKFLSPIMRKWVNDATDLTALITKIAHATYYRFGKNWKDIYNAYFVKTYDPIENYSMTEESTTNTNTELTNTSKGKTYGFNSTDPVNDSETEITTTGDGEKNVVTGSITRSGNIGTTTSQTMLRSEVELRVYDYWQNVFADIDRLLCFMMVAVQ